MEGLEILSGTAGGALVGAVFSAIGKAMNNAHERNMALLDKRMEAYGKADASADAAVARVPMDAGKAIRRFIIFALVFSFVIAPFIFAFFSNIPVAVERDVTVGGWFWGLIPYETKQIVEYVRGFYIPAEFKTAFMAIVGFYFGRSAVK